MNLMPTPSSVRRTAARFETVICGKTHLRFVALQPCLLCGRSPSDPHHLRFAQPRAMGRKNSDEFVVPLCRTHHRQNHQVGDEVSWWKQTNIDPLKVALRLWQVSRGIIDKEP
jgi:hypothetical protein